MEHAYTPPPKKKMIHEAKERNRLPTEEKDKRIGLSPALCLHTGKWGGEKEKRGCPK